MGNEERAHRRYVSSTSYWARQVPRVRHLDLDLFQYCPRCLQPQLFCEIKPSEVDSAHWRMTRYLAAHHSRPESPTYGALIVEPHTFNMRCSKAEGCECDCHSHDYHQAVSAKFYDPATDLTSPLQEYSKERLLATFAFFRERHQC